MTTLYKLAADHFLAVPVVAAGLAAFVSKIDDVILFTLRFFDAATIKAELDRLDALAKAEVDKEAATQPK